MLLCCCGTGPIHVLGCPCQVPSTLTMTVANPALNFSIFQTATITWQIVPAGLAALDLGAMAFLSPITFSDTLDPTEVYGYQLFCSGGFFSIAQVYITSSFGSPFRTAYRYRWLPGLLGGTCSPFLFPNGQVFQGAVPQVIELSG